MSNSQKINTEYFQQALKNRETRENLLILIIEDQKFSRLLLKNHLAKTYDVIEASQGEEGLFEYACYAPDIVFLDIELSGMNGHEVAESIKKLDKDAYVIMVTANNNSQDIAKAKENKAKDFIIKPYKKDRIYSSIEEFISQKLLTDEFIKPKNLNEVIMLGKPEVENQMEIPSTLEQDMTMNNLICNAIDKKLCLKITYEGYGRVIEPHAYGTTGTGKDVIRAWQVRGGNINGEYVGWKMFQVGEIVNIQVLEEKAQAPREGYKRDDKFMFGIYSQI